MFFKKNKPTTQADPAAVKSENTTTVPSENVSVSDIIEADKEKQIPTTGADSRSISSSESRRKVETTGLNEAKALDHLDAEEEIIYPTGAKLAFITFALCISVFLMALVCFTQLFQAGFREC
jgi:hypothetical protein